MSHFPAATPYRPSPSPLIPRGHRPRKGYLGRTGESLPEAAAGFSRRSRRGTRIVRAPSRTAASPLPLGRVRKPVTRACSMCHISAPFPPVPSSAVAVELAGHRIKVRLTPSGRRWFALCTCGFVSSTAAVERFAVVSAVKHHQKVTQGLKRYGLSREQIGELTRDLEGAPWPDEGKTDEEIAAMIHDRQAPSTKRSHPRVRF